MDSFEKENKNCIENAKKISELMSEWPDELIDFMERYSNHVWQFHACRVARNIKKEKEGKNVMDHKR